MQQCKADYGFDPTLDGEITAARKLGERQGSWANVWKRFAETPERYPGIADQLRKARPEELIVDEPRRAGRRTTRWPRTSSAVGCATSRR